ncbi:MAG TPA: SusC/RagA family TonB-linked outer membrane protein [Lutibacter sp.]|nr:SusC/RagA family TonB-linked outer membrane protein [Lutibacter sp.]
MSVKVKGTTKGAVTDFDGNYTIKAKTGDTLEFSHVSYTTIEKIVGTSSKIDIAMMESGNVLDEVVVTAIGRKFEPKKSTVAIQTVGGEDFQSARETNVVNSLAGKIAGIQVTASSGSVGASSRVILRGATSLTGNNQPLYIIDGVPINNENKGSSGSGGGVDVPTGMADINPDDIESVSVLKGPAAAALYGVRASNGVIVVKTKRGRQKQGLGITFNTTISMENPLLLPSFQNSYGQGGNNEYFEWINGTDGDGGVDESWGPPLDVGLNFVQWNSNGEPAPWVSQPDNIKDFYDTGVTINSSVSLAGGGDDSSYRFSVGNMDQKGMVPFTEYKRFTVGANGSKEFGKITSTISVSYTKGKSDNLPVVGYNNENPVQQMIWSGRNVDFNALKDWRNLPLAPAGTAAAGTPANWNTVFQNNPFWVLETNRNTFDKDRVVGNFALSMKVLENLTLSGGVGMDFYSQLQTARQAVGSNNAPNGSYNEVRRNRIETNTNILANYNKNLTDDLNLDVSFGGNAMVSRYKFNYQDVPQLEIPGLYTVSNLRTGQVATSIGNTTESKINSLYGIAKFGYKDYFFLEFTGRNDWASVLPTSNNSFFYPSVTASVVVSEMMNNEGDSFINFLKIRGGWAEVGGFGSLGAYQLQNSYSLNNSWGATFATVGSTLRNPDIKPESTTGIEVGIDSRLLNNKIRFNLTYYNQTSTDLIASARVSSASGYTSAIRNIGEMNNTGIEIQLGTKLLDKNDWTVDLDFNYAKNKNEVIDLGGLESLVLGGQWSMTLEAREGHAYGDIVGSYYQRDDNGSIIYANGTPQIVDSKTKVLGNVTPDWTGGVNLNIGYKNWNFSGLVDAKIGGDIYSMTTSWGRYAGVLDETLIGREHGVVGNGVMNIGTVDSPVYVQNNVSVDAETFNKAAYSNSIVESSVFDASYVKLRQLQLAYKLPRKLIKNTALDGVSVSIVGRNLAILHKNVPHIDPETSFSDSNGDQGQEFGQLPSARSIGFNLNLKF